MTRTQLASLTHRTSPTLAARMARIGRRWWQAYWEWRARRATVHILRALDSRTLRDIGINPSEVESYVYGRRGDRRRCYHEGWRWGGGA